MLLPEGLKVRAGSQEDIETVLDLLEDAELRLSDIGIRDQWPSGFHRKYRDWVAGKLAEWECWFLDNNSVPVGMVMIAQADDGLWQAYPAEAAQYIHKLTISRVCGGKGLGRILLSWAESRIGASACDHVRLDCLAGNTALCDYYIKAGYTDRGVISRGTLLLRLFEKKL